MTYHPKSEFIKVMIERGFLADCTDLASLDEALLAGLDAGHLGHATLDVFRQEPLPADHPFWRHPKITVSPHVASETRPETAAEVVARNIRRGEAGDPFLHLVDRGAGY
mgnify:CR=1 FL=1